MGAVQGDQLRLTFQRHGIGDQPTQRLQRLPGRQEDLFGQPAADEDCIGPRQPLQNSRGFALDQLQPRHAKRQRVGRRHGPAVGARLDPGGAGIACAPHPLDCH